MTTAETLTPLRKAVKATVFYVLFFSLIFNLPASGGPAQAPDLSKTKNIAEMQHEIVMLLIKKKDYEKAAVEANKIFELKWPDDQEPLLLKELLYLSNEFLRQGQAQHSLKLIEKNSKRFKSITSQIAVLKEKGYVYKSMGQDDKAIECFRQAQELENKK